MRREDLVQEWLEPADEDGRAAEHLRDLKPEPREIICFHYQQAAEKHLKAVIQSYTTDVPKSHDLLLLLQRVAGLVPGLESLEGECNQLNDYAVTVRYPVRIDVTDEDVEAARRAATRIRHVVRDSLTSGNSSG